MSYERKLLYIIHRASSSRKQLHHSYKEKPKKLKLSSKGMLGVC